MLADEYFLFEMTRSEFGIALLAIGGLIALLGGYLLNTANAKNSALRHKAVMSGQAHTDARIDKAADRIIDELSHFVDRKPDLIEQFQGAYPLGFAIYGYKNGQLSWIPIQPKGPITANADWGRTKFDFESVSGHIQLHVFNIIYDSPSSRATIDEMSVTGIPVTWRMHQQSNLIRTPEGSLQVGIDIIDDSGLTVYVIGFRNAGVIDPMAPKPPRPPNRSFNLKNARIVYKGSHN